MDGPTDDHTKWSKSDRDKCLMILLICGIEKNHTSQLIYKTELTHTHRKQIYGY